MAGGFRPFLFGTVLVALFSLCGILFAYQFESQNNPQFNNISNGNNFSSSVTAIQNQLTKFNSLVNDSTNTLASETPNPVAYLFLIVRSGFTIPQTFLSLVTVSLFQIFAVVFPAVFGSAFTFVFNVVLAILVMGFTIYIINYIRTGSSER